MDIEFEGQYDKKQYRKGVSLAGRPSKRSTMWRIVLLLAVISLVIWAVITSTQDPDSSGLSLSRMSRSIYLIIILGYFVVQPYIRIYTTTNRLWKDPIIRRKITGTISTQGISFGKYLQEWGSFFMKRETGDMVVLVTADRTMLLLPRNFFKSDHDWTRFLQLVEQKVKEPK